MILGADNDNIFDEQRITGSSNGRTVAFEAINWGSNPCPVAKLTPLRCFYFDTGKKQIDLFLSGFEHHSDMQSADCIARGCLDIFIAIKIVEGDIPV